MRKNKLPIRLTGQHFTIDKGLIADAIKIARVNKSDIILDIGAGKGFLSVHLVRQCASLITIENDKYLLGVLRRKFGQNPNVIIIDSDFRDYTIPKREFKVVSNIPFRITSYILKSLMFDNAEHFMGGSLIMQFDPVQKLFSKKVFNPYIVFYHTFFTLKLMYVIYPESFIPPPSVRSALLKIEKKEASISFKLKEKYLNFLFFMLKDPTLLARTALKSLFRKSQVRDISEKHGIRQNILVINLSEKQWAGCFLEMLDKVPEKYHPA